MVPKGKRILGDGSLVVCQTLNSTISAIKAL